MGGQAALIGDASHAVVPFYGQGMNAAFEHCAVLDECIGRYAPADGKTAFVQYEGLRRGNTDALADLSLSNFVEMRDRVVSPAFLAKKQAEKVLGLGAIAGGVLSFTRRGRNGQGEP